MKLILDKLYGFLDGTVKSKLLAILSLALFLRVCSFFAHPYLQKDSILYLSINHHIVNGNIDKGLELYTLYPPSLLYTLKLIYFTGVPVDIGFRVLSIFLSVLMIIPFFYIARSFLSEKGSLLAAFLLAIHPKVIEYSHTILRESIAYPCIICGVAFMCYAINNKKRSLAILAGLAFAIAYMARVEYGFCVVAALFLFVLADIYQAKRDKREIDWHKATISIICLFAMVPLLVLAWLDLRYTISAWDPLSLNKFLPYIQRVWK